MAIVVSTATFSALSNGSIHLDTQGSSRPAVLVSETDPNNAKRVNVYLPDMFILFLSEPPRVNPHYETVRRESETWLSRECNFDFQSQKILTKTDFSYFCAITVPDAAAEELRTVCDWGNWVFPFDDMFDNGSLRADPHRAQRVIDCLLAGMGLGKDNTDESIGNERALVEVHNSVWRRIVKSSPIGVQRRFAKYIQDYCQGSIEQVQHQFYGTIPTIDEMLTMRRQSAGVAPLFALSEYALKLDLPDEVFANKSIQEIECIGVDFVVIQNDILSYCKEEKEGVTHNLVAICRRQTTDKEGIHPQQAFDRVGEMLSARYRNWYLALANLPSWGEKVDMHVQQYIASVKNVVLANLNWSFRSERYFGPEHDIIRRTRVVTVLRSLPVYPHDT